MWINVQDKLPEHNRNIVVKLDDNSIGIAEYNKDFGFIAEFSAYDIFVHDDSGINVTFYGQVIQWMSLPEND